MAFNKVRGTRELNRYQQPLSHDLESTEDEDFRAMANLHIQKGEYPEQDHASG
jgi:hypothetical protein